MSRDIKIGRVRLIGIWIRTGVDRWNNRSWLPTARRAPTSRHGVMMGLGAGGGTCRAEPNARRRAFRRLSPTNRPAGDPKGEALYDIS